MSIDQHEPPMSEAESPTAASDTPDTTSDPFVFGGEAGTEALATEASVDTPSATEPEPAPLPIPKAEPVKPADRVTSVDVLRGVALMGILAMNINGFGWPFAVYENPVARPGADEVDIMLWSFNHLVFDTKMMTIFSMLFGAGLVLMDGRAEAKGAKIRGIYYRRTFWLLMIGLVHAYLIWDGDILVDYALCGFLLYLFRKKSAKTLLITGVILTALAVPVLLIGREVVHYGRAVAAEVEAELQLDIPQSGFRNWVFDRVSDMRTSQTKQDKKLKEDIQIHRGDYWGIVVDRAGDVFGGHVFGFLFFIWWAVGGRMLIGMGLMKLGVFSAERSWKLYAWMTAIGYGIGLPLIAIDTYEMIQYNWSFMNYGLEGGMLLNMVGGVVVVMGHIGLVMMICKGGLLPGLTRRLGAAGRMALSNYLFDSIFLTTLFNGYGFGLYGKLDRGQLYLIVIAIWVFQLWFSPIWLKHFRYGPAEWVWRSLTYWKFQSMRPKSDEPPLPPPSNDPEPLPTLAVS